MVAAEPRRAEHVALAATTAVITATLLLHAPGRIVPETKLDLLVDPARFLGRALGAWDPSGGFGRIQNQAVGYLFPMGAWSWLGHALHLPPWIVQRLWIAAVVSLALWGAHRVAVLVGVGSPGGRVVAAWAYAFAPATLATAAFQSAGQLPYSLAPWVLVPLLHPDAATRPRRAAARSALFVAAMGGVNGASAFAVLPLAAIWLLTRAPGRERRALAGWWAGGVVLATLWWLIPLWVSVRYGVRFTTYTEQANLTTTTESATEILRGTGNWLAYLPIRTGYWLPGAHLLATSRVAIVGSVAVAAAGIGGLARRDVPGRAWLVPSALLGVVAMGVAYTGSGGGSFGTLARDLLDGPAAPLRNVHKAAALVRLPLALGLGHLVCVAAARWSPRTSPATSGADGDAPDPARSKGPRWAPAALATGLALAVVVVAIAPALPGRLTAPGSFDDVPHAWRDAAAWLDEHEGTRRALVLPGSGFGEYRWGRPLDEPLSSLMEGDWAIRDLVPLGGNGSTRLLDGIDQALVGDQLPAGFVPALQRAGVRYLVIRNDLDLVHTEAPSPASVRRLLATAPDIRRVRGFGPTTDDRGSDGRLLPHPGDPAYDRYRQVEVYEVRGAVDRIAAYPAAATAIVGGGPEGVLQLPPELLRGRATVLAVDESPGRLRDPLRVTTDTARRRDVLFGAVRGNATYTLTADEVSPVTGDDPEDRWAGDGPDGLSVARVEGAAEILDDAPRTELLEPDRQPGAAFDGSATTAWVPKDPGRGHWLQVRFDEPRAVSAVKVQVPSTVGQRVASVRVATDHGSWPGTIGADGTATIRTPGGVTGQVRVTIESVVTGLERSGIGLAEVQLVGVDVRRAVVAAPVGPRGTSTEMADWASLSRLRNDRWSRFRPDEEGELRRVVDLVAGARRAEGTAVTRPGPELDRVLATVTPAATAADLRATASSRWHDQPAYDPAAAADGDPTTAWVSDVEATAPTLRLAWRGPVEVRRIRIRTAPAPSFDQVGEVVVSVGDRRFRRTLPDDGVLEFPATRTDHVSLAFPRADATAAAQRIVGVTEVEVDGLDGRHAPRPDPAAPVDLPCGQGPSLTFDGDAVPTRARATAGDLLDGRPVEWSACPRAITVTSGAHRVVGTATGAVQISTAVLLPIAGVPEPGPARTIRVTSWGRTSRRVAISGGPAAILATTENFNKGWQARLGSEELRPIRVDGWRQGWVVPSNSQGTVEIVFVPGDTQKLGLAVGLVALLALVALAAVPGRRGRAAAGDAPWDLPSEIGRPVTPTRLGRGTARAAPPRRRFAERPLPPAVALVAAALVGVALAGPVVLVLVPLLAVPHRSRWMPVVAAAATAGAGVAAFLAPQAAIVNHDGTLSWPAQVLATVAVLALAVASVPDDVGFSRRQPAAGSGSTPSSRDPDDRQASSTGTTPEGTG